MSPPDDSLPGTGWRAGSPVMTPVEGGGPWSGSRVVTRRLRAVLVAAREAAVTPAIAAVPAVPAVPASRAGRRACPPRRSSPSSTGWRRAGPSTSSPEGGPSTRSSGAPPALTGTSMSSSRRGRATVWPGGCAGGAMRWPRTGCRSASNSGGGGAASTCTPWRSTGAATVCRRASALRSSRVFEHRAADRTRGRIGGRRVVVATAARLMELHRGYEPRPEDLHDIALLRRLLQSDEPAGGGGEPAG